MQYVGMCMHIYSMFCIIFIGTENYVVYHLNPIWGEKLYIRINLKLLAFLLFPLLYGTQFEI